MDLEILGSPGWREGLLAIIALLLLYIVVLYVRMRRLQRGVEPRPSLAAQSAVAAYAAIQQPEAPAASADQPPESGMPAGATAASVAAGPLPVAESAPADFPWNEAPPEVPGKAMIDALQREVYLLRCEVDELRGEVLAAREDLRRQAAQAASSTQGASPLYKEAMHMAIQGHDATAIAHRCGIARAEADLVVALARNRREGFESGSR